MPFPATPSPFRLSRRQHPRRSAGPQFANSPRFLLSQGTPQNSRDEFDILDDEDGPPLTAHALHTLAQPRNAIPPRRQKDLIEDSEDGELPRDAGPRRDDASQLIEDDIHSTPPRDPETPGVLDAEFDAVFAPVREGHKRQRLSAGKPSLEERLREHSDQVDFATPAPKQTRTEPLASPAPPAPSALAPETGVHATPRIPPRPIPPGISTPANTTTPFRSKPRFMLSSQKPPSSQPVFTSDTPAASRQTSPPASRRKPAFVLPRSPSPSAADEDIPAPFSPSSRTLHRRGRPRSGVPGYAPGGMAAEVRSWILEMGSKREQPAAAPVSTGIENLDKYLVAARVVSVKQTVLVSSGPLAFIQAEAVGGSGQGDEEHGVIPIVAMGAPKYKPSACQTSSRTGVALLQAGDLVGVHRGLAWEVDIHASQAISVGLEDSSIGPTRDSSDDPRQRWLVAMEWDLIQTAS